MSRNIISNAIPGALGAYSAFQLVTSTALSVKAQLAKTVPAGVSVALFAASDATIIAGTITGTFNPNNPLTWPNAGVGVTFVGVVQGGAAQGGPLQSPANPPTVLRPRDSQWDAGLVVLRLDNLGGTPNLEITGLPAPSVSLSSTIPTTAGHFGAYVDVSTIVQNAKVALSQAAALGVQVALFTANDATLAPGTITGTFNPNNPLTWPNAGVGVTFVGVVQGGAAQGGPLQSPANPPTVLYVPDALWDAGLVVLRLDTTGGAPLLDLTGAGSSSLSVPVSIAPVPSTIAERDSTGALFATNFAGGASPTLTQMAPSTGEVRLSTTGATPTPVSGRIRLDAAEALSLSSVLALTLNAGTQIIVESPIQGSHPVFVYQPGGTALGNTFTTWATTYAAAQTFAEYRPIIIIDSSMGSPIIPAGAYNVDGWTLRSRYLFGTLTVQDGATFGGKSLTIDGVNLTWVGTSTSPITNTGGDYLLTVTGLGSQLTAGGSATNPFYYGQSGAILSLYVNNSGDLEGRAPAAVIGGDVGSIADVYAFVDAQIEADSLAGLGSTTVFADLSSTVSATQPGLIGANALAVASQLVVASVVLGNTSAQTISSSVAAAIVANWATTRNTVAWTGSFNAATGVFTAGVAGTYQVNAQIEFAAAAATLGAEFTLGIYRNGTIFDEVAYENPVAALSTKRMVSVSGCIPMAAGDTLDVRAAQASGGSINLTNATNRNRLSIVYCGG